ncbi:MAG: PAS domain S-box protein [Gemmatales bacterium]
MIVGLANHTVLISRDGLERNIDDSAAPIRNNQGDVVGCVLVFRDITERRRLERQVSERAAAARLLASIVESSEDAIISKTLDGTIQSWNAAAERLFGYRAEQAVGRNITLVIPADRLDEETRILAQLRAGKRIEAYDTIRMRSDGRPVHVSLTISPIRDEAGQVIRRSKIVRDISQRKQAEEALRTTEEQFRRSIARSPMPIMIHNEDDTILQVSDGWTRYSGYTIHDIPTVTDWTRLAYGEQQASLKQFIDELFRLNDTDHTGEYQIRAKTARCERGISTRHLWEP